MGSALRKLKRGTKTNSPLSPKQLQPVYYRGFDDGAKAQREADIDFLVKLLADLESIPGVGLVTADKVREYFLGRFGNERN